MKIVDPDTLEDVRNARYIAMTYLESAVASLDQKATYPADIRHSTRAASDAVATLKALSEAMGDNYFSNRTVGG